MNLHWPQYVWIGLAALSLTCGAVLDGQPKKGKHHFSAALLGRMFGAWLLWCGGFFG